MKAMRQLSKLFVVVALLFSVHLHAQREYWGLTSQGGKNFVFIPQVGITNYGSGVIFKTDKYGRNQQVAYHFDTATGFKPVGSLTQAGNGKLYGFATDGGGGVDTLGCFFEFDPITSSYRIIKHFLYPGFTPGNNLSYNGGKPLLASDGKIYGLNFTGATTCRLFEYNPATDVYLEKLTFNQTNYLRPLYGLNSLMQAVNGRIYINFSDGCILSYFHSGQLYEYNPINNSIILLYSYPNNGGSSPTKPFLEYSPGILYNTFSNGNNFKLAKGGIHKFDIVTNTIEIVARFDTLGGYNGFGPSSSLVRVGNKLYGTTYAGGPYYDSINDPYGGYGVLFEFDPATNALKNLWNFGNSHPDSLLESVNPGALYFDIHGKSADLFAASDTLWGLTEESMFYYKISTGEFKSLFGLTAYKGRYVYNGSLTMTCTKPYLRGALQDTINVPLGAPFSLNIHSPNSETFQWIKGGSNYPDTDSILNFPTFNFSDTGRYRCKLTNECGDSITKVIYLTANILPVQLLSFKAVLQNQQTLLTWTTAHEVNNRSFTIERSSNPSKDFQPIGTVNGHGTTTQPHGYHYTDESTPDGISYYRLKQTDNDGKTTYSSIEKVNKTGDANFTISPNPATGKVLVTFSKEQTAVRIEWISAAGQVVQNNQYNHVRQQSINVSRLPAGMYTLKVTTGEEIRYTKLIIENR